MRGTDITQESLFSTVHLESFVPDDHPLRPIKVLIDQAMKRLNWLFDEIYSARGRVSIPPERLIRAQLLQVLYSIRSERLLVEQINYNLLCRWFIGLTIDDAGWDHSGFTTNRNCLLENEVIPQLFDEVVQLASMKKLLSDEHFSVDGTHIQAWASHKGFAARMMTMNPMAVVATLTLIFTGKSVPTRLMNPKRMAKPSWPEKAGAKKPSLPTWGTR